MFRTTCTASDGKQLALWRWDAANPKGTLVILHGMAEHARRYDAFAVSMMKAGYSVLAPDLRGHGETAAQTELGDFGPGGWKRIVRDVHEVTREARTDRVVLMGHSMGSTVAACAAQAFGESYCGLILSTPVLGDASLRKVAPAVAKAVGFFAGEHKPSVLLDQLSFGKFNKPYEPASSHFKWLSSVNETVELYDKDPLCGFICTAEFFRQVASMINASLREENIRRVPDALPVEIFAGGRDPAGKFGEQARFIRDRWTALGKHVGLTIYPESRHEIHHDVDAEAMTQEVASLLHEWCA